MKIRLFGFVAVVSTVILNAVGVFAQNETLRSAAGDKYVISAKAGGVNYVEGTVGVARKEGRSGLLLKGDTLEIGDRVSTGANGRAEILLNPGSYLRLGGNSAFEFMKTSLEDLEIQVESGSAILEVFAANDFRVTLKSSKSKFSLVDSGIYRLDVDANGSGRLEVWKGRAEVGGNIAKSGRVVTSADNGVAVAKFDRGEKDELEIWSKARAKELAKAGEQLQRRELRNSLMTSFFGGGWNIYNSFGLWVFDSRFGRHCFLPFGYGWNSPYGYGFGNSIWSYRLPQVVFQPPRNSSAAGSQTPVWIETREDRTRRPPFAQMQGGSSSTGRETSVETTDTGIIRVDTGGSKPGRSIPTSLPIIDVPVSSGDSKRKP